MKTNKISKRHKALRCDFQQVSTKLISKPMLYNLRPYHNWRSVYLFLNETCSISLSSPDACQMLHVQLGKPTKKEWNIHLMNSAWSFDFHIFLYLQILLPNVYSPIYSQMSSCPDRHERFFTMEQVILSWIKENFFFFRPALKVMK